MGIWYHFVKRESFPSKGYRLFAKTLPAPWGLMSCKATLVGNKRRGGMLGNGTTFRQTEFVLLLMLSNFKK